MATDLARFFNSLQLSGGVQPGFEAAQDVGLSPEFYLYIPAGWPVARVWATVDAPPVDVTIEPDTNVWMRNGRFFTKNVTGSLVEITPGAGTTPAVTVMRQFIAGNRDRTGGADKPQIEMGLACRFAALIGGHAVAHDTREYQVATGPDLALQGDEDALLGRIKDLIPTAITWLVARYLSWRRTGHATGGTLAAGIVRKVLAASGYLPKGATPAAIEHATTLFYQNTHLASCHTLAAVYFASRPEHWSCFKASYGFQTPVTALDSFQIRAENSAGVAGTAIVMDCYVVLQNLYMTQFWPVLQGLDQLAELRAMRDLVIHNGLKVGKSSRFWCENAPTNWNIHALEFNQKSENIAQITADLARAAVYFLRSKTLRSAPALKQHSENNFDQDRIDTWRALSRIRIHSTVASALAAVMIAKRQAGGGIMGNINVIDATDETRAGAVANYNIVSEQIAQMLGVVTPQVLTMPTAEEVNAAKVSAQEYLDGGREDDEGGAGGGGGA